MVSWWLRVIRIYCTIFSQQWGRFRILLLLKGGQRLIPLDPFSNRCLNSSPIYSVFHSRLLLYLLGAGLPLKGWLWQEIGPHNIILYLSISASSNKVGSIFR